MCNSCSVRKPSCRQPAEAVPIPAMSQNARRFAAQEPQLQQCLQVHRCRVKAWSCISILSCSRSDQAGWSRRHLLPNGAESSSEWVGYTYAHKLAADILQPVTHFFSIAHVLQLTMSSAVTATVACCCSCHAPLLHQPHLQSTSIVQRMLLPASVAVDRFRG
jgi:hypothetical protein